MHATAAILALLPAAVLGNWDPKVCNGAGGCQGLSWFADNGFRCPSGAIIGLQPYAHALSAISIGNYTSVDDAADFPASCERPADVPGAKARRVKHTTEFDPNITIYGFITDSCDSVPVPDPGNCYSANPNPSPFTPCRTTEKDVNTFCKQDKSIGLN